MIDLKENRACTLIVRFSDNCEIELVGHDAADIWNRMGDAGIIDDIYKTTGRYRDLRFTMPVSLLPHMCIN